MLTDWSCFQAIVLLNVFRAAASASDVTGQAVIVAAWASFSSSRIVPAPGFVTTRVTSRKNRLLPRATRSRCRHATSVRSACAPHPPRIQYRRKAIRPPTRMAVPVTRFANPWAVSHAGAWMLNPDTAPGYHAQGEPRAMQVSSRQPARSGQSAAVDDRSGTESVRLRAGAVNGRCRTGVTSLMALTDRGFGARARPVALRAGGGCEGASEASGMARSDRISDPRTLRLLGPTR